MKETVIEKIPEWAVCYIFNGDAEGLTDEEIEAVDKWFEENGNPTVCPPEESDSPSFSSYPAFGRQFGACMVYDLAVVYDH